MQDSDGFDEEWSQMAARLNEINKTLMFCPPEVRYDLQRNVVEVVEELANCQPLKPELLQSVYDIAETMVSGYEGRGKVHIGLRRIADREQAPKEEEGNLKMLDALSYVFEQNVRTDNYLLERQLVRRDSEGNLSLTIWGNFVLGYLNEESVKERNCAADKTVDFVRPELV